MLWVVDRIKTRLFLEETAFFLEVPIQIEIEYAMEGMSVRPSSVVKKIYFNRPLLLKECPGRSADELDRLVDQTAWKAIEEHFSSRHYTFERGSHGNTPRVDACGTTENAGIRKGMQGGTGIRRNERRHDGLCDSVNNSSSP
ncbi:MAG TPA: hypothetical protein P5244_16380 [Syntrophales bacterium]|jgi:hypothetical protein|nr:hypothetical protein [Syntrophales bacterium]HRT62637.1 hypothetical protein [Syntrophales bacterium]